VARLVDAVRGGELVCVDGGRGEVVIAPDEETRCAFERRRADAAARWRLVTATSHLPATTADGTSLAIGANVESARDVAAAVVAGADHIGLVRTELLYLGRVTPPSEEEQLADAIDIVRAAAGRMVTFRTLDVGADKLPAGLRVHCGPNPALGLRGIRLSLRRPELFRPQLRALYRAAVEGPMRIMFPLVSTVAELRAALAVCRSVWRRARRRRPRSRSVGADRRHGRDPERGVDPRHLAAASAFLSIGTNDLIQYAFAADREDGELAGIVEPLHPAVLRALRQIVIAAEAAGCDVCLCGDMAGDPANAWILVGLGLRRFSMSTREIPFVKSLLQRTQLSEAVELARDVLVLDDSGDIAALARARLGNRFALELDARRARGRHDAAARSTGSQPLGVDGA
jgi:phosphotransferase system enzyme I (PtsI)